MYHGEAFNYMYDYDLCKSNINSTQVILPVHVFWAAQTAVHMYFFHNASDGLYRGSSMLGVHVNVLYIGV